MKLDKLIEELNPYVDNDIWAQGFKFAFALFLNKEKHRHQEDIENINQDLDRLGYQGVDLSRLNEFIEV